ncbi:MAG: 3-hydroxybutyryl-CoA dehydrogenase, partial [Sphingobacteriia bacterium]
MQKVAVIGAGTMGNGIAHVFAQFGFAVTLVDVQDQQLENAIQTITKNLDRQVSKGSITEAIKTQTLQNITAVN